MAKDSSRADGWLGHFLRGMIVVLLVLGALGAGLYWGSNGFTRGSDEPGEDVSSPVVSASEQGSASVSESAVPKRTVVFPDVESVSRSSAESVARRAVESLTTWDTAEDAGFSEAAVRTVPLFDEQLAAGVQGIEGLSVAWDEKARQKKAFSSPHVMDYEIYRDYKQPVKDTSGTTRDGRMTESLMYAVRWDWLGQDGSSWAHEGSVLVYEVTMVKDAAGEWSVLDYGVHEEVAR